MIAAEERLHEAALQARATAARLTRGRPEIRDDVAQEGLLKAWRLLAKHPDADEALVRKAVRDGVLNGLAGKFTSTERAARKGTVVSNGFGGRVVAEPVVRYVESLEGRREALEAETRSDEPATPDHADAVETRVTVLGAVHDLPEIERRYVWARFWADLPVGEAAGVVGLSPRAAFALWHDRTAPALREALGDLAAA